MRIFVVALIALLPAAIAQIELDREVEAVLAVLEQELTEAQQRALAERLVVIRLPLDQLFGDYRANEERANELYRNNLIEFSGRIVDIDRGARLLEGLRLFLEFPEVARDRGLALLPQVARCGFVQRFQEWIASLRIGDVVTVQGTVVGLSGGYVAVNNCQPVGR